MITHDSGKAPLRIQTIYKQQNELDPVLYEGEDIKTFCNLRDDVQSAAPPGDALERMLADSIILDHWEAARDRRHLMKFVSTCEQEGLRALLIGLGRAPDDVDRIVADFARGAPAEAAQRLAAAGYDLETVRAKAIALNIDAVGKLEAMIRAKDKHRDRCQRDLLQRQKARRAADAGGDAH